MNFFFFFFFCDDLHVFVIIVGVSVLLLLQPFRTGLRH